MTDEAAAAQAPDAQSAPPTRSDPQAFSLRATPPRVMRLSRKAMAVIGISAGIGIGGSLTYALRHQEAAPAQPLYSGGNAGPSQAESVTAAPSDYAQVPKLGQPLPGDLGRPLLSAQQNGQPVPVPGMGPSMQSNDPHLVAIEQARQRVVQERDAARTSRLFLGGGTASADGAAPLPTIPAAFGDTAPKPSVGDSQQTDAASSSPVAGRRAFLKVAGDRTTESDQRVTTPGSANVLQAGSVIPAALITGIRSDLPGQITAQVTQNVYDSPTGRILLIPQGSRLVGNYHSDVAAGQSRVLLAWDRLIFADGRSLLLDRQPGADASGFAGLHDRTDYHWGSMLKAALVSTLLGVGTELTTQGNSDLVQALRYGTQDTVNQTGRQLVQREVDVPPTLTVRPGYPLRIIVTRDLVIERAGYRP